MTKVNTKKRSVKYHQGAFYPKNYKKYEGNVNNIMYRSGWEKRAFQFCDENPNIIAWSSEETVVGYLNPATGRFARYFIDLKVVVRNPEGGFKTFLIEIKPYAQTQPPRKGGTEKAYAQRVKTYLVNQAKWKYARDFCAKHGYEFIIWTEKELFPK